MKNIFDFATKELSQDAFLCWVFANYDETELSDIVRDMLTEFCELSSNEKITDIEIWRQWRKIDIWVVIKTDRREEINLLIEDKTYSCEHSQLETYNSRTVAYKNVYKIFYKTSVVAEDEQRRVQDAGWRLFDIQKIFPLFKKYINSSNLIVKQYVEHLKDCFEACINIVKPKNSENNIDWLNWQSYFNRVIIPKLKDKDILYKCSVWKAGQYPYVYLNITKLGYNKNTPYLEIRSRDCRKDEFLVRILCYGVAENDLETQQEQLIENIKAIPEIFVCNGLVRSHKGKRIYPKQVGCSVKGLTAISDDEFIALVEKYAKYYLQVMKDWK